MNIYPADVVAGRSMLGCAFGDIASGAVGRTSDTTDHILSALIEIT
jgi:hypothetical protein